MREQHFTPTTAAQSLLSNMIAPLHPNSEDGHHTAAPAPDTLLSHHSSNLQSMPSTLHVHLLPQADRLTAALRKGTTEAFATDDGELQLGSRFVWRKKIEGELQGGAKTKDIYEREKKNTEAERRVRLPSRGHPAIAGPPHPCSIASWAATPLSGPPGCTRLDTDASFGVGDMLECSVAWVAWLVLHQCLHPFVVAQHSGLLSYLEVVKVTEGQHHNKSLHLRSQTYGDTVLLLSDRQRHSP